MINAIARPSIPAIRKTTGIALRMFDAAAQCQVHGMQARVVRLRCKEFGAGRRARDGATDMVETRGDAWLRARGRMAGASSCHSGAR
jgi:hypothetical protein